MSSRYDNIPISGAAREGMNLNSDSIQYLCRMFSVQDNAFEEMLDERQEAGGNYRGGTKTHHT
jgi:hypothetical protein